MSPRPPREKIGEWELHERIGEGAFGVVFAAEQSKPVRRSAALKLLRPGMGSKQILARFEAESQTLALLNHPDIVTIYDAGRTDDGRPFFAMEFVPGEPVTRFADPLSLGEKLRLFDRICAVVEHAHGHGIIHRDLKPGNILAYRNEEGENVIKLLDFGIAKATEHILTEATILTEGGNFLGTPEYMSPEQTMESDIDIRADIYSLGILLFELLAGRPPFVLDSSSLDKVLSFLNRVRDEDPPTLSSVSEQSLTSDLDWIVGKAIEKNRERRYKNVSELREDLKRYRNDQPVLARPPDTFYIAKKFLRRNWKLTATIAAIFLSVAGAAVVSSIMAYRAKVAAGETKAAFSVSHMQSAIASLDLNEFSEGIARLTQSLRTNPENRAAAMLLRATMEQYPLAELVMEKQVASGSLRHLRVAHFSKDDGSSTVVAENGKLIFLDPEGEPLAPSIGVPGTNVNSALSHHKRFLALNNIQGDFLLIDLETFQPLPLEQIEKSPFQHFSEVLFSLDDRFLCMGTPSGKVTLWDTETGEVLWNWNHEAGISRLVFTQQDRRIAVATKGGHIIELDTASGSTLAEYEPSPEPVLDLVDSGSGHRYYGVSSAGMILAVDAAREPRSFTEQRVEVPLRLSGADPNRRLSAYLGESEASIWTVDGRTIIRRLALPSPPTAMAILKHDDVAYIATQDKGVLQWSFGEDRLLGSEIARAKNTMALQYDTDSHQLRSITRDGVLRIHELPSEPEKPTTTSRLPEQWKTIPIEYRNQNFVLTHDLPYGSLKDLPIERPRSIGLSDDRSKAFAAYRDGFIRAWDLTSGELIAKVETVTESVRCCDLSPDGTRLLYRNHFSNAAIYDLTSGKIQEIPSHTRRDLSSVEFSPSGDSFAIATDDGTIDLFDATTGNQLIPQLAHDVRGIVAAHYCRFSDDGSTLVSWGEPDRSFRFWDTKTGMQKGNVLTESGDPKFGCFLDNGRVFATVFEESNEDLFFRLWSLSENLPISPRKRISLERLHEFDFSIPDDRPFTLEELNQIDERNGIQIGRNGISEIPLNHIIER